MISTRRAFFVSLLGLFGVRWAVPSVVGFRGVPCVPAGGAVEGSFLLPPGMDINGLLAAWIDRGVWTYYDSLAPLPHAFPALRGFGPRRQLRTASRGGRVSREAQRRQLAVRRAA